MFEDLNKIIDKFGIYNQLKKFNEESYELIEAIRDYQDIDVILDKDHIEEEIADCMVLLMQFINYYQIDQSKVNEIMKSKVKRTLERIESGYYGTN